MHPSAPTDLSLLFSHFCELLEEAQQYLIWASIFSLTYIHIFFLISCSDFLCSLVSYMTQDHCKCQYSLSDGEMVLKERIVAAEEQSTVNLTTVI